MAVWNFLQKHSLLCISSLPSPQVASLQPKTAILLDFLCRSCIPAPSRSAHWQTHILTYGVQGFCLDHLRRYHSVLSATDWSFHPYQAPSNAPLLSQLISPPVRGFHGCGNSQPFRSPRASGSVPLHSLFFFLDFSFILPGHMGILPVLSNVHIPLPVSAHAL